jgi:hypothetical protein
MSATRRLFFCSALVCGALVTSSVVALGSSPPIRSDQHFVGLVNGRHRNAIVRTVCPGPAATNPGPVAVGQTMAVAHVSKGNGDTGLFREIYAWFVPAKVGARPTELRLRAYATPVSIPTSIRGPCDGTGVVEFSSCPYLAPCAYGWVPFYVHVRFVNMAA